MDEQKANDRLGEAFGEAFRFAHRLHADQRRKGPDGVPYVAHLVGTSSLVLEAGGDEEQAIAALLHDAAEDQGGEDVLEEIRERFGERVARIVDGCSDTLEHPKPPWRERKEAYLASLPGKPVDVLLVSCADKLYNARAILRDHRRVGDALWERFDASAEATAWYYRGLLDGFRASQLESWLVDELEQTVAAIEGRVNP
jgi:GTP pyrophosphokinase